jgi:hypothetical protein
MEDVDSLLVLVVLLSSIFHGDFFRGRGRERYKPVGLRAETTSDL